MAVALLHAENVWTILTKDGLFAALLALLVNKVGEALTHRFEIHLTLLNVFHGGSVLPLCSFDHFLTVIELLASGNHQLIVGVAFGPVECHPCFLEIVELVNLLP